MCPVSRSSNFLSRKLLGGLIVAAATVMVLAIWVIKAVSSPQTGWDFPVFYIAARLPAGMLYDRVAFAAVWKRDLAPLGVPHWAAYIRPPAFALLLHPLGSVPYAHALWSWMFAGVCAYLASVGLLIRKLHLHAFFYPLCVAFFPAMAGIMSGQDNAIYLLAFVAALILFDRGLDVLAGAVLVICLCKFHLVVFIPVLLVAQKRYMAMLSFTLGAICTGAVSFALTPFGDYVSAIENAQSYTAGFYPVGLRGFSMAIGQPWSYGVLAVVVGALCCWLIFVLPLLDSMCVAITGALLLSPYIAWYDSTLLIIPLAVLAARGRPAVKWTSIALLTAIPAWEHGGGNNGPLGFMHVAVEGFVISCSVLKAIGPLVPPSRRSRLTGWDHTQAPEYGSL
jgi:alpha-1,2-mannosyltransferase